MTALRMPVSALRREPPQPPADGLRVLIVARSRHGRLSPFVEEQAAALARIGVRVEFEPVVRGGVGGYIRHARTLARKAMRVGADIIHAHFGMSGLASTWQRVVPTVVTFHGTDINDPSLRWVSRAAAARADAAIVVSPTLLENARFRTPTYVVPCGIDLDEFYPEDHDEARRHFGFGTEPVVVFASARERAIKNFPLAQQVVSAIPEARLVEIRDMTRADVRRLLSAGDVLLMTSHAEGSPQIVKEALAVGCPVVSTDVGDVRTLIDGLAGCHITTHQPDDVARKLSLVLNERPRIDGRSRIEHLSNHAIAQQIAAVYHDVVSRRAANGR